MREIKFRYRLENTQHVVISGVDPGGVMTSYLTLEDLEGTNYTSMLLSYPILSRDLYIGLIDKNGVEIYVGDIINSCEKNYYGNFDVDNLVIESIQNFFARKGLREDEYGEDWSDVEIIGNIYENLELK